MVMITKTNLKEYMITDLLSLSIIIKWSDTIEWNGFIRDPLLLRDSHEKKTINLLTTYKSITSYKSITTKSLLHESILFYKGIISYTGNTNNRILIYEKNTIGSTISSYRYRYRYRSNGIDSYRSNLFLGCLYLWSVFGEWRERYGCVMVVS